jgi:hypothetical protein
MGVFPPDATSLRVVSLDSFTYSLELYKTVECIGSIRFASRGREVTFCNTR